MHHAHHKGHARHADKHENKHHHWPEKHQRCWAVIAPPPHGITSIASVTIMIVAAESEAWTQIKIVDLSFLLCSDRPKWSNTVSCRLKSSGLNWRRKRFLLGQATSWWLVRLM